MEGNGLGLNVGRNYPGIFLQELNGIKEFSVRICWVVRDSNWVPYEYTSRSKWLCPVINIF